MREGYKVTELGEIPEDWDLIPLYELRNKQDRYAFTGGPFGSDLKSKHYTNEGVKVIQLQDIGEGVFIDKSNVFVSEEKANQLISCNIYPDEIILAKMAPVARCCKISFKQKRYLMSSDGIRLSVDKLRFENEFVFQALNSKYFRKEAESQSTGTTRGRIGLNDLKLIPLAVPKEKKEQQKIAEILSTVDEKIEVINAKIIQTQTLKKGLMQKLLTKGIGHTKFKESELGMVPESWEVVKISNIGNVVTGNTPKTSEKHYYADEGFSLVSPADLGKEKYISVAIKQLSKEGFAQTRQLPSKSILVTCIGSTIGKIGMSRVSMATNQQINSIICNADNEPEYMYYVILSMAAIIKGLAGTQAVPLLNKTDFSAIPLIRPPLLEQKRIGEILCTVDEKLEVLQAKKENFMSLKKGLMQQLLTGKMRVKI